MTESPKRKSIEVEVEIDASPEAVWEAISNAEELRRWFALDAAVEPGVGGSMTLSWGPEISGTAQIEAWEENRHLRAVEEWPTGEEPVRVAVDYRIEGKGGRTVLRLVSSGFQADDDWAEYIETLDSGWRYFLWNLKHYVERHRGTPRRMVWARRKIEVPKQQAWDLLFGTDGLVSTELPAAAGGNATLWSGEAGTIHMAAHPIHLACQFESLNDALLLVELEPGQRSYSLGIWLSLYGVDESRAAALEASLGSTLERLFD